MAKKTKTDGKDGKALAAVNPRDVLPSGFLPVGGQARSLEVGETLVGEYRGSRELKVRGQGTSVIYSYLTLDGVLEDVWGSATLTRQMAALEPGDACALYRAADVAPRKRGQSPMKAYFVGVRGRKGKGAARPARKGPVRQKA